MTIHAFKDAADGYYQIDVPDGEDMPEWTKGLTPCDVMPVAQVVDIPQQVTRFQALAALHNAGMLDQVEAMMAHPGTDKLTVLAWQNALDFKRTSPMVLAMAGVLSLTDQQLNDLFIAASQIE